MKKILLILLILLWSRNVYAAALEVSVDKNPVNVNDQLTATVLLDTEGESINTLSGDLHYEKDVLNLESINIGGSFISFWIEKPENKAEGVVSFSGIIPGGISTNKGELFRAVFRAKKSGSANLLLNNINLFLNDGQGSAIIAKIKNSSVKINIGKSEGGNTDTIQKDNISPEKFAVMRAQSPSLFDNKWFVVFSTMDKESGIDRYQVCEFWNCSSGESPFLLKNQTPFYYVVVKAYDLNGNSVSSHLISAYLIALLSIFAVIVLLYLNRRRIRLYRL
jgi:hypothetical protein